MPTAHSEIAAPRQLAAIRVITTQAELGAAIIGALDKIWPALRAQAAKTGHNVVIYRGGTDTTLTVDVGVETTATFPAEGEIVTVTTPSGEVATVAHFGDYSELDGAYAALEQWCADNNRAHGVSWEVYGDWEDEPARRRTDIYFLLEPAAG